MSHSDQTMPAGATHQSKTRSIDRLKQTRVLSEYQSAPCQWANIAQQWFNLARMRYPFDAYAVPMRYVYCGYGVHLAPMRPRRDTHLAPRRYPCGTCRVPIYNTNLIVWCDMKTFWLTLLQGITGVCCKSSLPLRSTLLTKVHGHHRMAPTTYISQPGPTRNTYIEQQVETRSPALYQPGCKWKVRGLQFTVCGWTMETLSHFPLQNHELVRRMFDQTRIQQTNGGNQLVFDQPIV